MRLDEVLAKWHSDLEAFPEAMRTREETGCCATYGVYAGGAPHAAPGAGKPPPP